MQLDIIQVLLGIITLLLGVIAWGGKWGVAKVCSALESKVDKDLCREAHKAVDKEHLEIWDRVNHHQHNGGGKVVIG